MKNSNLFPLLNLASLKIIAQDWARRYPAIEKLTLYSGQGRSTLASYVVVAKATMTEDPQSPLDFVFEPLSGFKFRIKNLKPCDQRLKSEVLGRYIKKAQLTEDEAEEFRKQVSELNRIRRKRIEEEYAQKGAFQKDWSDPLGERLLEDLTSQGVYVYKDITSFINADDWFFRIIEKEEDLLYLEDDIILGSAFSLYEKKKKKLRPCQKDKEQVRKLAEDLWRKDPTMTYGDIYKHREMQELLKSFKRREPYVEKTITGWTKDLNPDPKVGRPKKSPAVKNKQKKITLSVRKIVNNK
jgi:hypothetical protein